MEKITPALIHKFFSNNCNANEAALVKEYFDAHPTELEHYISTQELLDANDAEVLDTRITNKMLAFISKRAHQKGISSTIAYWAPYAAAASIIGFIIYFSIQTVGLKNNSKQIVGVKPTITKEATFQTSLKTITNNQNKQMLILLEDGSSVKLSSNSTLQYQQPFINNKRELYLIGNAFFKVAKDKSKPFIVITNNITTTALGTSFIIDAPKSKENIVVQLLTGKVAINKINSSNNSFKTTYLVPGQQIEVNKLHLTYTVSRFKNNKFISPKTGGEITNNEAVLAFQQEDLYNVFEKLNKVFGVSITYNLPDIKGKKFTGKFERSENIVTILNSIALLNNLTVSTTETGYSITK